MEEPVKLDVDSVLNWLNIETKNDSAWTKFINKVENLSLKWNNLKITVVTKRAFWDYICWFFFFILRCIAIVLIPLYLISVFWLNFADSWNGIKDNFSGIKDNVVSSLDSTLESAPLFEQTKVMKEYVWMMDELLEK